MVKKKILIFKITAGGGHTAAAKALSSYLAQTYDIITLDIFIEVVKLFIIPGHYSFTDFYNHALNKQHISFLNISNHIARLAFKILKPLNKKLIKKTLERYKPDCIISVTPLVNDAIMQAASELNIPFLVIPVDFDPRTFLYGIQNPDYKRFYFARTIEHPQIQKHIGSSGLKEHQIIDTGFIIRADFLEPKDPIALKKQFNIPEKVPVVMIMLGAMGGENTYTIARELYKINMPCHVLFCTGQNTKLFKKLSALKLPPHITMQVIGFTDKISDLMAVSDIFVTKSGSNSVGEALYMNLPVIIARFGRSLTWEKFNVHYLTAHNYGLVADSVNDIYRALTQLLQSPRALAQMKEALKARKKEDINQTLHQAMMHIFRNENY